MSDRPWSRERATVATRVAQGAFVVGLIGAGALAGFGVPALGVPGLARSNNVVDEGPVVLPTIDRPVDTSAAKVKAPGLESPSGIGARFGMLSNRPRAVVAVVNPTTSIPVPVAVLPTYLGPAQFGALKMALIKLDGKQKFVREEQKAGEWTVVRISDAVLRVKDAAGVESDIDIAPKTGSAITQMLAAAPMQERRGFDPIEAARRAGTGGGNPMDEVPMALQYSRKLLPESIRDPREVMHYFAVRDEVALSGQFDSLDAVQKAALERFEKEKSGDASMVEGRTKQFLKQMEERLGRLDRGELKGVDPNEAERMREQLKRLMNSDPSAMDGGEK